MEAGGGEKLRNTLQGQFPYSPRAFDETTFGVEEVFIKQKPIRDENGSDFSHLQHVAHSQRSFSLHDAARWC